MAKVEVQLRRMSQEEAQEMNKLERVEKEDEDESDKEWKDWEEKQDRDNEGNSTGTLIAVVVLVVVMGASICIALIMVDKKMSAQLQQRVNALKGKLGSDALYSELGATDVDEKEMVERTNSESWTVSETATSLPAKPDRSLW
jgi:hypothetical protein